MTGSNHRRTLLRLHRTLGLTASLFVCLLALTGVMLNHSDTLRLDERHLDQDWLLDWYGIAPATTAAAYEVDGQIVTGYGGTLYIDEHPAAHGIDNLVGAVALTLPEAGKLFLAASPSELLLFTPDGQLVERSGPDSGLPVPITRLGLDTRQPLPLLDTGQGLYISDRELLAWHPASAETSRWSHPIPLPAPLGQRISAGHHGRGLTLERILLDIHSGRIGGPAGVLLMDLAAVALLVLVGLGIGCRFGRRPARQR